MASDLTGQIGLRMNAPLTDIVPWLIERITRSHTHHTVVLRNKLFTHNLRDRESISA